MGGGDMIADRLLRQAGESDGGSAKTKLGALVPRDHPAKLRLQESAGLDRVNRLSDNRLGLERTLPGLFRRQPRDRNR